MKPSPANTLWRRVHAVVRRQRMVRVRGLGATRPVYRGNTLSAFATRPLEGEANGLCGGSGPCSGSTGPGWSDRQVARLRGPGRFYRRIALAHRYCPSWSGAQAISPPASTSKRRLVDGGQAVLLREVHDELAVGEP